MFNPFKKNRKINLSQISKDSVEEIFRGIKNDRSEDVISSGIVTSVIVNEGKVGFLIDLEKCANIKEAEEIKNICESALKRISGINKVNAVITNEGAQQNNKTVPKPPTPKPIPGIKKIIAVASGKGGVGKSTISANLAIALAASGKKVGLADADIHGPSVAKIMGLSVQPEIKNNKMIPPVSNGVKCMSMGFLLGENSPAVWRGPMVAKALSQLMLGADWGELDYLVIDMPPGTGDVQLSMLQNFKVDEIILVTTPQEVALLDVKKALTMFRKMNANVIGVIENMAYYAEEAGGRKIFLFGQGGVEKFCTENNMAKLAEIPVSTEISKICDEGIKGENVVSDILKNINLGN